MFFFFSSRFDRITWQLPVWSYVHFSWSCYLQISGWRGGVSKWLKMRACEGEGQEEGSKRGVGEEEEERIKKQRGLNLFKGDITPR